MKIKIHAQRIYPPLEDLTVIPTTAKQEFTHPDSYGYDKVEVEAVTADIDSNIQPENIKKDVEILGKVGTLESPVIQPLKTVTLSSNVEEITADSGYDVINKVEIDINVTSDGKFVFEDIKYPDNVTSLGSSFFKDNQVIKSVYGEKIRNIGSQAFWATSIERFYSGDLTNIGSYAFYQSALQEFVGVASGIVSAENQLFQGCSSLRKCYLPVLSGTYATNQIFWGCTNLEDLKLAAGWNKGINISQSTKYSRETLVAIFNNLADLTGQTAQTLTIGAPNIAKLTAEDIAIATNKGWIVS